MKKFFILCLVAFVGCTPIKKAPNLDEVIVRESEPSSTPSKEAEVVQFQVSKPAVLEVSVSAEPRSEFAMSAEQLNGGVEVEIISEGESIERLFLFRGDHPRLLKRDREGIVDGLEIPKDSEGRFLIKGLGSAEYGVKGFCSDGSVLVLPFDFSGLAEGTVYSTKYELKR